jgi:uncharacterized cupredoxin-like copper-binding protein
VSSVSALARRGGRRLGPLAGVAAAALGLSPLLAACGADAVAGEEQLLGPGPVTVELEVEHSRFSPERIRVVEGTDVTFVLDNGDPIGHELIVGDAEVHATHEAGTHGQHGAVPGEVSVGAGDRGETTFHFHEPGTVEFACHLPRHYGYGMHGEVVVVPA